MQSWKTPVLSHGEVEEKRAEIKQYFNATYDIYEQLFVCLKSDEVYYERPESLRHPLIFYFGHTATFFVNKLITSKLYDSRVDEKVESMMAIGVDEMSWDDLDNKHYQWPTVDEVRAFRDKVRELVNNLIDTLPLSFPIDWEHPLWIIMMGIEHERIHLETSSVLIRQLPMEFVKDLPEWPLCPDRTANAPANELLNVQGKSIEQGRSHPSDTYGWDNEYGTFSSDVKSFKASKFLVSNKEFLGFMLDGGYECQEWWTDEGRNWKAFKQVRHPVFWVEDAKADCGYRYRALYQEIDMPMNWPVELNYLEAKAFCNWLSHKACKKIRLPSEAEWYCLHEQCVEQDHVDWQKAPGNINLEHWASSTPIDAFMQNDFGDVIGNVWQWTETAIDGFAGFKVHPSYDDFSVPTFDGRHNLIKGGSWVSTGNESIADSRYAFRRHFYQHAGFRYIESDEEVVQEINIYETDDLIAQYLEFHYGQSYFGVANFSKACIDHAVSFLDTQKTERALDIGCAVGRNSYELARTFDYVDGVDFSTRFIRNAVRLREHGKVCYQIPIEGDIMAMKEVSLDDLQLGERANNIEFTQGDACNLRSKYTDYDLVFAGNLIDRLYDPEIFLRDIPNRMRTGGLLVLTSPYTWLEEYTEKKKWIGGIKENGENLTTYGGIKRILSDYFDEVCEPIDVPFVIRETARKHQHTLAHMTVWKKR
jgi:5-histidylcysteine sulfoxide synthase/putative 4-mercaptohistidine N1-methyltranferase